MDTSTVTNNTLTLLNTSLLLTSGVVSVGGVHALTMKTHVQSVGLFMVVVALGTSFMMVQCCEYIHLYWCLYSWPSCAHVHPGTGLRTRRP